MGNLNDLLYGAGRIVRRATTVGGSPAAVASVRSGERMMADESAANALAFTPQSRDVLAPLMSSAIQGYRGTPPSEPSNDVAPSPPRSPIAAHAARLSGPPPSSPINEAAIRSSNARAASLQPQLARTMAEPLMEPMSQGTYVSTGDQAENLDVAARGAERYSTPEWKTDYSQAQNAQDEAARADISNRYRAGMERTNAEEQLRGNPMDRAIQARQRSLAYEDLLPADATSRIRAASGRGPMRDFGQEAPELGMPTMGEYKQNRSLIAQAAARQNPKDVAEGATTMGRGRIAEELDLYRRDLQDKVKAGKMTEADATASWAKAAEQARALAEIMKTGYPPVNPLGGM